MGTPGHFFLDCRNGSNSSDQNNNTVKEPPERDGDNRGDWSRNKSGQVSQRRQRDRRKLSNFLMFIFSKGEVFIFHRYFHIPQIFSYSSNIKTSLYLGPSINLKVEHVASTILHWYLQSADDEVDVCALKLSLLLTVISIVGFR